MKKHLLKYFTIIIYFFIIGLMSCGNETENKLTGEWTMIDMHNPKFDTAKMVMQLRLKIVDDSLQMSKTTDSTIIKKWKQQANFIQNEIDNFPMRMKEGMDSTQLHFYPKGTFISIVFNSRDTGTWEVNEKTNRLITTNAQGRVDSMMLFSVTDDSMRLGKDSLSWMIFKKVNK
jgi:hypothetical protein